jgi:hypothetical protein
MSTTSTKPVQPLHIPRVCNASGDGSAISIIVASVAPGAGILDQSHALEEAEALVTERLNAAGIETESRDAVERRKRVDTLEKTVEDSRRAFDLCGAKIDELHARRRVLELTEHPNKNYGRDLAALDDDIQKAVDEKELAEKGLRAVVQVLEQAAKEAEAVSEATLGVAYTQVATSVQEELDAILVEMASTIEPLLRRWLILKIAKDNRLSSLCNERRKYFSALEYQDLLARVQDLERRLENKAKSSTPAATA